MAATVTVNDVLDGQVALDLGYPIPSPAIFDKIGTVFRRAVARFADEEHILVVRFTKADRKIETMRRPYLAGPGQGRPVRGGRDRRRAGVRQRVHRHQEDRWELSMRQVEVSRTIVFIAPRHARGFFEALVADNLDIGRPDQVELIFSRHPVRRGRPPSVQQMFSTKVVTRGVDVTVNACSPSTPASSST
jgi:hypothetical protein